MITADRLARIDLAHTPGFRLARLAVTPALRQVVRDDGASEVVEPRVMQVLVALVEADGAIVSRDDLSQCCWEGRVVGDDAINRVISRLRRLAEGLGEASFRIETVTKVGYRLIANGQAEPATLVDPSVERTSVAPRPTRRSLIGGMGALAAAAGVGAWALLRDGEDRSASSPEVEQLMQQGMMAIRQVTSDGSTQAVALFERATVLEPGNADAWGLLAVLYGLESHARTRSMAAGLRDRSRSAAARALALDPTNVYARQSRTTLPPLIGHWREKERLAREVLRDGPTNDSLMVGLGLLLGSVGRMRESAVMLDKVIAIAPPGPGPRYVHASALWGAGRMVEADRAFAEAFQLFPRHFAVWYSRFYYLMYTGRATEAIAMGADRENWPAGMDPVQTEWIVEVARAIDTRAPAAVGRVIERSLPWARKGAGYAENVIQFASALGRLDEAFAVVEAFFFGRGFVVPDIRFVGGQGTYTRVEDRRTNILFMPPAATMRRDPRFRRLTDELGLERYWRESGIRPDYRA
ncbi:winged helix-turn-helix domain-containing protein [uncultured Sphingomonas sp.]|uniref:winged helix-turn-helix domain-containing protein n=1 Tax=uncultured Sphingomonas sp. TaxID=158754 RepID=UPI0035CC7F24